jgi:hypothetical protein
MLGCERHLVRLVPYQAAWAGLFQQEAERLSAALGGQVVCIEHVGSTAIPGVDAKPILDIVVAVRDMTDAAALAEAFRPLGYVHKAVNDRPPLSAVSESLCRPVVALVTPGVAMLDMVLGAAQRRLACLPAQCYTWPVGRPLRAASPYLRSGAEGVCNGCS